MIWSLLSLFDLYRLPILLYYNGTPKRSSILGLLSSFIIYIYLFYSFFKSNLYLKENPIVVVQNFQNQHADVMHFDENKFIAFGVSDVYNNRVIDPSIYSIVVRYFYNESYFETKELKICDLEDAHGNQTFYDLYGLQYVYCLKNKSFYLENTIDENARYLAVSLFVCNNATSNNTCKSQKTIDDFFNSFTSTKLFSVVYDDTQVNVDNYEVPFKKLNKVEWHIADPAIKKRTIIYFKKTTVATDSGWLFPNLESKSNFLFSSTEFDFQIRQNQNQPVYQYLFFSSKDEVRYMRRYQTVAEFLGGFAGVAKLISIICAIFINNFIYIDTLKHILNNIYAFPPYVNKKTLKKTIKKINKKTKSIELTESKLPKPYTKYDLRELKKSEKTEKETDKRTINQIKTETLENHLFTKAEEPGNEILKMIPDVLKKELGNDSFVLEHFSQRSNLNKEKLEISIKQKNMNEIPVATKSSPEIDPKIHEVKISQIQNSEFINSQSGSKIISEKKKRNLKERIMTFFKRKKDNETQTKSIIKKYEGTIKQIYLPDIKNEYVRFENFFNIRNILLK